MRQHARMLMCGVMAAVVGCGVIGLSASGQVRVPRGAAESKTPIQVSLSVGTQRYESSAPGKCTHAPMASIYQVVSELWSVQQSDDGKSMSLSLWRPKDGSADMVSLSISSGRSSKTVSTIRGAALAGSGKVALATSGKGGVFTVDAKTADGAAITGTIKCDAFAPHVAEGG
jgi:outer membrane usher protein FimD/PapC